MDPDSSAYSFVYYKHLNCLFWTCTLNPENSTRNTNNNAYLFLIILYFIAFFYLEMQIFLYFEMYTGS